MLVVPDSSMFDIACLLKSDGVSVGIAGYCKHKHIPISGLHPANDGSLRMNSQKKKNKHKEKLFSRLDINVDE